MNFQHISSHCHEKRETLPFQKIAEVGGRGSAHGLCNFRGSCSALRDLRGQECVESRLEQGETLFIEVGKM